MPTKKRTKAEPNLSLEGIQLCLHSAERLLADSTKVSEPTALALTELALEEASKGLMMMFLLDPTDTFLRHEITIDAKEQAEIDAFLEGKKAYIGKLPRQLGDAFRRHHVKLRFLRFALQYDRVSMPILRRNHRYRVWTSQLSGSVFRPGEASEAQLDELETLLRSIRVKHIPDLQSIKEAAFYVGLTPEGNLVSPEAALSVLGPLRMLTVLTILGLKMSVAMYAS